MNTETMTDFFKWCTVYSGGLLIFSSLMMMCFGDFAYKMHGKLFQISKETFHIAVYSYLGIFKLLFITFGLVPYLALLMLA